MHNEHDVVVIGAGLGGLYAVHKLRDQLGLDVRGFDTADGVGGTWWWNRYPGCRCDFESIHYSYSFSDEIQEGWEWSERFAAQPEILAYIEWVADKLDLRRAFTFNTRVTSTTWDGERSRWIVQTDDGQTYSARYVVSCVGVLSVPKSPEFAGSDTFTGELYRTSSWPQHQVDFAGKRVAVIGTGSTGIQVIQEVAKDSAQLTVFQRSPAYASPLRNEPVEPAQRRWNAEHHAELRAGSRRSFIGVPYDQAAGPALAASAQHQREVYDRYYNEGGFPLLLSTFNDLLFSKEANDTIAEYVRERIRERVKDSATAELLIPTDHPYGSKRPPFETNYYEVFNQPNVELVDVRTVPIEEITPTGIRTGEQTREFDIIVFATGFDAITAPQVLLNVTGRDSVKLSDSWVDGPSTLLGSQVAGFPNFFMINGPQSTAVFYNGPLALEDGVDFAAGAIAHLEANEAQTIEPTPQAQQRWGELCADILDLTLIPQAETAWWRGGNVPGKPRGAYMFVGGAPLYRAFLGDAADHDYAGFALDGKPNPLPPLFKLSPPAAVVLGLTMTDGQEPQEPTLDDIRAQIAASIHLQAPGPQMRVESIGAPSVRIYIPAAADGPLPVLIYIHGGGFVAGSIDLVDSPARLLADSLGVVVVAAGYRLAPEHPFSAAPDDIFDALSWVRDHIDEYGGDPRRIVIGGDSAGANLAAVTALRARDAGIDLAGQILISPPIDPDASTPSRTEFAAGPVFTTAAIDALWATYLSGAEITPVAAPSRAESLAGVAPALVVTVEVDPLRDEAENYARDLAAAGVPVTQRRFDGLFHGTLNMTAVIPDIQDLYALIGTFLQEHVIGHVTAETA
ncbi:esterase [Rhodococcus sp. SC4]|nr:esterase [Rhodococcus sp. SC4]